MAISPELQKLLDTAGAVMPTPVPYAQQPIQFVQPQVQQPVFQPIQINTTLPTPYASNVPTFQHIQQIPQTPITPVQPNFDGLMSSIGASGAGAINNTVNPTPIILPDSELTTSENIIRQNLPELGYSTIGEAKTDIEATKEADAGRGILGTINNLLPDRNFIGNTARDIAGGILGDISVNAFEATSKLASELEQNQANKKANKIKAIIGENVYGNTAKENENIRKETENLWIQPNLGKVKLLQGEGTKNFTQSMTKGSSNFANVLVPYISAGRKREVDLIAQGKVEEAAQLKKIIDENTITARNNLQRQINRISVLQQANQSLSDNDAADLAAQEEIKNYGSVNNGLLDGLKNIDGSIVDGRADKIQRDKDRLAVRNGQPLDGNIITRIEGSRTWEDFLNNQANGFDNDRINETSSDPLRQVSSNLNRYIFNPISQAVSRTFGQVGEYLGANNAAADAGYISGLGVSERKKTSNDDIDAFGQEIFDILPELTTSIGGIILTMPLQQVNLLKGVGFQNIGGLTKLNQAKAITNTLGGLGRIVLGETIQNGVVDAFQQNSNADLNYYANLFGSVLGSVPELIGLGKQWKNFYSIKDMTGLIKNNYIANKAMKRAEEGKTREEIGELKKGITDEQMVSDIGPINEEFVNKLVDNIDVSLKAETNIKQNIAKQKTELEKKLIDITDQETRVSLQNELTVLNKASKEYDEGVNFQIGQQAAIKKLFTKDSLTPEDIDEFARVIKTVLPNTRDEQLLRQQVVGLAIAQRNIESQDALLSAANASSLKSSDSGYAMSQIEKTTGLQVGKSYTSSEIEDVISKANGSNTQRWLGEIDENGDFKYFNKLDGKDYILNDSGLAKLNLTEVTPNIRLQREMASLQEGTESARYLDIVENNKEAFDLSDEELNKIKDGDIYNSLLEQIDNFIPCIR